MTVEVCYDSGCYQGEGSAKHRLAKPILQAISSMSVGQKNMILKSIDDDNPKVEGSGISI